MKINEFTTTVIEADDDKYITQADEVELKNRIIAKKLALGKYDTPDNYIEISVGEAEAIKGEKEKLMLEEIEKQ